MEEGPKPNSYLPIITPLLTDVDNRTERRLILEGNVTGSYALGHIPSDMKISERILEENST